ncbi:MAG: alpha/beta hydrolase [Candidatus Nanopelagicaceae bacterium]
MSEVIRPSTVLPAQRLAHTFMTADGLRLIGEIATPNGPVAGNLVMLHPLPTHGGMMDSHLYKKAANRLPAMAGLRIIRFNTRGTASEAGRSEGHFDEGNAERLDVEAVISDIASRFSEPLWVVGWSFGTDLALRYARDARVRGLILLSPPLRTSTESDLKFWGEDGRPVIALVPELDDYLKPDEARRRFSLIPQAKIIAGEGIKHLWVGEPAVYRALTEITQAINPSALPLPTEI